MTPPPSDAPATGGPARRPDPATASTLAGAWRALRGWPLPARVAVWVAVALVLALVLALLGAVVVVRRPLPPGGGTVDLPGLSAEVEVVRDAHGVPQLYGDTPADLFRAQGYLAASERFFQMDVRRHVAAGRLAEMFGEPAVRSDVLARTLGWERTARAELALVAPDTRAALSDYAAGVNAYLAEHPPSDLAVEYVLLDLRGGDYRPAPWTEVDTLAWLQTISWELSGNLDEEVDRALTEAAVGSQVLEDLYPRGRGVAAPVVRQGAVVDGVYEPDADRGGSRNPRRPPPAFARRAEPPGAEPPGAEPPGAEPPGAEPPGAEPPGAEPPGAGAGSVVAGRPDVAALLERTRTGLRSLPTWLARGAGRGSNAWAVSGELTTTGAPVLANDPHLDASLPGVWLQVGLHCRTVDADCPYDVAGFSLPGVPGVVIGHNADIAWGMANLGADVTDLFLERVRGETYRYAGQTLPLRSRRETIRVEGGADVDVRVRTTRHGPLLSDVFAPYAEVAGSARVPGRRAVRPDGEPQEHALAVRWTGLRPSRTADAVLDLDRAGGWEDFRDALSGFELPAQGFVYADTRGRVGFQAAGRIPVRRSGNDGSAPSAGWRPENEWTGRSVPYAGLPSVVDPDDGVVVAANQVVAGADYPYLVTSSPDRGYRARRIQDELARLAAAGGVSPGAVETLQTDTRDPLAPALVPALLDVDLPDGYESDGQDLLRDWDATQPADSAAAAYYNVVWQQVLARTFRDELPEAVWPDGGPRWVAVVDRLLDEPDSPWWDDLATEGVRESRDDVLADALVEARDELTRHQAVDPGEWTWGREHRLDLVAEPYGRWGNDAVRRLLNRSSTQVGGGGNAVDATAWDAAAREPWQVTTAPSMRMLVPLDDLDEARWVALAGVSGHPASGHYTDQLGAWQEGRLLPWPFTADAVRAAGEETTTLRPAEDD